VILLDTNVISEAMRAQPAPSVRAWLDRQPSADLFLCAPVVAELRFGIAALPTGRRRAGLEAAFATMLTSIFGGRIAPFDGAAAQVSGDMRASRRAIGRPLEAYDSMIAAIAASRGMILATRNLVDFDRLGLDLVDPFAEAH
jgi:predicted nucleic acid-binding protein